MTNHITLTAEQAQQIEEALEDLTYVNCDGTIRSGKREDVDVTDTAGKALAIIRAARAQEPEPEPAADQYNGDDGHPFDREFHAQLLAGAHLLNEDGQETFNMGWNAAKAFFTAPALPTSQDSGTHYGIIDPDYARVFTMARCLAWQEGYALAMHGSFTRDLDVVAVPWTDSACDPNKLAARIADAADLRINGDPGQKPHGRLAFTMLFKGFADPRFIDLSVMPRSTIGDTSRD